MNIFDDKNKLKAYEAAEFLHSQGYRRLGSEDYCFEKEGSYKKCEVADIALALMAQCENPEQKESVAKKRWAKELILYMRETTLSPAKMYNRNTGNKADTLDRWIRVGGKFYHRLEDGSYVTDSRQTFVDDFGKDSIISIEKFDTFCLEPNNLDYQRKYMGMYNNYEELKIKPKQGNWPTIETFLKHIFGEQYELGLDYLQLLYLKPKQILPILCLVSEERQTGKSTFGSFLGMMFEKNATKLSNDVFKEKFNKSYASKLVAYMDETKISDPALLEKVKDLATAKTINLRQMQMDAIETDFYCKFVMMSNNVKDFANIDTDEIRYWVRVIPPLSKEVFNEGNRGKLFEEKLQDEVAAFKFFLLRREMYIKEYRSRMWFAPEDIETIALEDVKKASLPEVQQQILDALKCWIEEKDEFNEFSNCGVNGDNVLITRITARILRGIGLSGKYSMVDTRKGLQKLFPTAINKTRKFIGTSQIWKNSTTCFEFTVKEIEDKLIYYDLLTKENSTTYADEFNKEQVIPRPVEQELEF